MKTTPVCVLFGTRRDAAAAVRRLYRLTTPPRHLEVCSPWPPPASRRPWRDIRVVTWALAAAVVTSLAGGSIVLLAAGLGLIPVDPPAAALWFGVIGGGLYGLLLGAVAGMTEPSLPGERTASATLGPTAAVFAEFDAPSAARAAKRTLLGRARPSLEASAT